MSIFSLLCHLVVQSVSGGRGGVPRSFNSWMSILKPARYAANEVYVVGATNDIMFLKKENIDP